MQMAEAITSILLSGRIIANPNNPTRIWEMDVDEDVDVDVDVDREQDVDIDVD